MGQVAQPRCPQGKVIGLPYIIGGRIGREATGGAVLFDQAVQVACLEDRGGPFGGGRASDDRVGARDRSDDGEREKEPAAAGGFEIIIGA